MGDLKNRLYRLNDEMEREVYILIDKYYRRLPKRSDGTIDVSRLRTRDNDIDALRHAYVSGVYTMEYNTVVAKFLGWANENNPRNYLMETRNSPEARNMDYWNNSVGRKYGKKSKTREQLFKFLLEALKSGELIIDLNDPRKFSGDTPSNNLKGKVIVLEEGDTGKNLVFFDLGKGMVLSKNEFLLGIKNGDYDRYEIRNIAGEEIPVSKRDGTELNNLG